MDKRSNGHQSDRDDQTTQWTHGNYSGGHPQTWTVLALAARQSDTRWLLLQGSDVRIDTVASANASTRFLRAAWLHAGLLEVAPDGRSLTTTRDLVFRSGSGLAQFCAGSKGRTLESWKPVAPDGGYDPDTAALIAG